MKLTLLGEKLSHSLSPQIHDMALTTLGIAGSYGLSEVAKCDLQEFMATFKAGAFDGMNVTIPYKTEVIPYLDELSDNARKIGAVNTILRIDNILKGYNTDYDGFGALLTTNFVAVKGEDFVVLGAGGAAKGIITYLSDKKAKSITLFTRNTKNARRMFFAKSCVHVLKIKNYTKLDFKNKVLINTTPVGLFPNINVSPVPAESLDGCKAVIDLIYNPAITQLMSDAMDRRIPVFNGLYMLVGQAIKAQEVWQGRALKNCLTRSIYNKLSEKKMNIVLIGMPGCGKSAIGKALAKRLKRTLLDMDAYIENHYGDISTLFNKGETYFRNVETEVAHIASKQKNAIICTGGGIVKKQENMNTLASTGTVVFIDRPLKNIMQDIDHSTRPLLNGDKGSVQKLYDERVSLYRKYAHCTINNDAEMEKAVSEIISYVEGRR